MQLVGHTTDKHLPVVVLYEWEYDTILSLCDTMAKTKKNPKPKQLSETQFGFMELSHLAKILANAPTKITFEPISLAPREEKASE